MSDVIMLFLLLIFKFATMSRHCIYNETKTINNC